MNPEFNKQRPFSARWLGILFFSAMLIFGSCIFDHYCDEPLCDNQVKIDAAWYENGPADGLVIDTAWIEGPCLFIGFSSGGCSGETWLIELLDSGAIMESYPLQRNIRLSLKNEELCDAWISREMNFNIIPLQVEGNDRIKLNLQGYGQLLYEY